MQGQDRIGQTLSNFRLKRLLGKGGHAEVYLAENIYLVGNQVAIKVLKSRKLDVVEQDAFRDEAKIMTTLEHPHIIKVLNYGIEADNNPYLVMEYAPLGTIRHLYPPGQPVPFSKLFSYTRQIAEALQYAHNHHPSIVHRDIKPENMLVKEMDDLALSDFGIAVEGLDTGNLDLQIARILQKMAHREQELVPGTAPYIAPERFEGHTQRASDQYSLAVVVYEWLCGSRPFTGSDLEICRKHLSEAPPSLKHALTSIPPQVEQVVMKGLEKKPENRFPSILDFARALEEAARASSFYSSLPRDPGGYRPPFSIGPQQPGSIPVRSWQPGNFPGGARQEQLHLHTAEPAGPDDNTRLNGTFSHIVHQQQDLKEGLATFVHEASQVVSTQMKSVQQTLRTDRFFLKRPQNRWFMPCGILCNVISSLLILPFLPLPANLYSAIIGATLSIFMLWRCVISVKKFIAITFGVGVALWWGYVVLTLSASGHSSALSVVSFFIAFIVSFGIHYWFVEQRLGN